MVALDRKPSNFSKDVKTRGCPVCGHIHKTVIEYFSQWAAAFVNQEEVQGEHAAVLGFCHFHTWQLESIASPRGISVGYPKLLERLSRDLLDLARSSEGSTKGVEELVQRTDHCRICILMRDEENFYVRQFVDFLKGKEGRASYARSQGVCLRHLALLLSFLPEEKETVRLLLSQAAIRFQETAESMKSYALKRDAYDRHLLTREERHAYLRALAQIAGSKLVCDTRR